MCHQYKLSYLYTHLQSLAAGCLKLAVMFSRRPPKSIYTTCVVLLLYFSCIGQTSTVDSLQQVLAQDMPSADRTDALLMLFGELSYLGLRDEGGKYLREAESIAQAEVDHLQLSRIYHAMSDHVRSGPNPSLDSGNYYLRLALAHAELSGDLRRQIKHYNMLGYDFLFSKTDFRDSALFYLQKGLALNEPVLDAEEKCYALRNISIYYQYQGDNNKALYYAELAEMAHEDNYHAYPVIARIYDDLGRSSEAIAYYLKALAASEKAQDENAYIVSTSNLAVAYAYQNEFAKALPFFKQVYQHYKKTSEYFNRLISTSNVGSIYSDMGQQEEALPFFREAILHSAKWQLDCPKYLPLKGIGEAFFKMDQLDSAAFYIQLAVKNAGDCGNIETKGSASSLYGEVLLKQGELDQSIKAFELGLELAYTTGRKTHISDAAHGLYRAYKLKGNFKEALANFEIHKTNADSLFNREQTAEISKLEAQYEFDREKEKLIQAQETEALLLEGKLRQRAIVQYAALGGVGLLSILLSMAYRNYRRKLQYSKVIERSRDQISQLSDLKEGLTHMIAHDMRNSLSSIIAYSNSEPFNQKMKSIHHNGQALLSLVNDMLDVQRFEEAKVNLQFQQIPLSSILEQARLQVAPLFQQKSVSLIINTHQNLTLNIDEGMMVRVVTNLLSNAMKHSPIGATVELSAKEIVEANNSFCELKIIDRGSGIPEESLPYIFDKFWLGRGKFEGRAASSGLGLTFSKLAVEAHGGTITVNSLVEKGTTFTIRVKAISESSGEIITDRIQPNESEPVILPEEFEALTKFRPTLEAIEVYEVRELYKLLSEMEQAGIKSRWMLKMREIVSRGDREAYQSMIKMLQV